MMVSSQTYAENGDAAVNLKLEAMKAFRRNKTIIH
jgi:hypothetical protein